MTLSTSVNIGINAVLLIHPVIYLPIKDLMLLIRSIIIWKFDYLVSRS